MPELLKLSFSCALSAPFQKVADGFNVHLFKALCPPFPKVSIQRFEGIRKGDAVSLNLDFLLFSWQWSGKVISWQHTETELRFTDAGEKLPPFLSFWKHEHLVIHSGNGSVIEDNIEFQSGRGWPDFLVKWMIILQMKPRRKIYRNYFENGL